VFSKHTPRTRAVTRHAWSKTGQAHTVSEEIGKRRTAAERQFKEWMNLVSSRRRRDKTGAHKLLTRAGAHEAGEGQDAATRRREKRAANFPRAPGPKSTPRHTARKIKHKYWYNLTHTPISQHAYKYTPGVVALTDPRRYSRASPTRPRPARPRRRRPP
jgi:hypothetical protein